MRNALIDSCCDGCFGGGGGIRTHETLAGLTVFKTARFNHSLTPPLFACNKLRNQLASLAAPFAAQNLAFGSLHCGGSRNWHSRDKVRRRDVAVVVV
jgi:hypothetical protein